MNDLHFIHADQGPEDGKAGHVFGHTQGGHGLTGNLTQGLAGNEGFCVGAPCNSLRETHHKTPHDKREEFFGTVPADLLLDFGKGDDMDPQPAAPDRQESCQFHDLILCLLGGIRRRDEMDHLQFRAAPCHHPGGNGAVETAGKQADSVTAGAHGKPSRARYGRRMDVSIFFPDFHKDGQLGVMHVHGDAGEGFSQQRAHGLGNLDGIHGKLLVCPFALHLEALRAGKGPCQVSNGGFCDLLHIFPARHGPGNADHAEYLLRGPGSVLHPAGMMRGRFHVNGALPQGNLKAAAGFQTPADVCCQTVFKGTPVLALQHDLPQFQKEQFVLVHVISLQFLEIQNTQRHYTPNPA